MEKCLDKRNQIRLQVASLLLPSLEQGAARVAGSPGLPPRSDDRALRFPPTRAARVSRSRGVFLAEPSEAPSGERSRWVDALGMLGAMAVAALALAVCVNTTSVLATAAFGANSGPTIAAAASVVPPFVLPVQSR
jgi:hypothetical protein